MIASGDLPRGATYTVRAYSPNPKPKQLAEVGNAFPASVAQSVTVDHVAIPVWGSDTKQADAAPDRQPAGRGQQSGLACVRGG